MTLPSTSGEQLSGGTATRLSRSRLAVKLDYLRAHACADSASASGLGDAPVAMWPSSRSKRLHLEQR